MSESESERYVRDLVLARYGVLLEKLPTDGRMNPDYQIVTSKGPAAALEVKNLERTPRDEEHGWTVTKPTAHTFTYSRKDNGPGRVAEHISKAAKQLSRYDLPRILVFLNDDPLIDSLDLKEAVEGQLTYGTRETGYVVNTASAGISNGRISEAKWSVDLYIWIDRHAKGTAGVRFPAGYRPEAFVGDEGPFFQCTSNVGLETAVAFFGCPRIPAP